MYGCDKNGQTKKKKKKSLEILSVSPLSITFSFFFFFFKEMSGKVNQKLSLQAIIKRCDISEETWSKTGDSDGNKRDLKIWDGIGP